MKVVILCGGLGTRLREETEFRPKPMVPVGGRPILWHIMKTYAHYGHKDFILCLGYRGEMIKEYFRNYYWNTNDVTLRLGLKPEAVYHSRHNEEDWSVTLLDTGLKTQTGGRLKRALAHIEDDTFLFTYGDGVIDSDINQTIAYHRQHGCLATVTAVRPISRFGELVMNGDAVTSFREKPEKEDDFISGGYFVLNKSIGEYLEGDDTILETNSMERVAHGGQLKAWRHLGFWQCMDYYRELELLNRLWESGQAPWKVWKD
jgi:glucose-1-phosphate cytidylyltransferase